MVWVLHPDDLDRSYPVGHSRVVDVQCSLCIWHSDIYLCRTRRGFRCVGCRPEHLFPSRSPAGYGRRMADSCYYRPLVDRFLYVTPAIACLFHCGLSRCLESQASSKQGREDRAKYRCVRIQTPGISSEQWRCVRVVASPWWWWRVD